MTGETIGQYSWQGQQGAGSPGSSARLTRAHKQDLLDAGFARNSGTARTGIV
jgi:hypothetical protein